MRIWRDPSRLARVAVALPTPFLGETRTLPSRRLSPRASENLTIRGVGADASAIYLDPCRLHATWPCRGLPSLLVSDSRASRTDCRCYNSQVPWRRELAGTDAPVFSQLDRVSHVIASDAGCSAFHASRGRGGASPSFCCVDARLDVLGPVDMCSPPCRRHACKVLLDKRRSRPFFDL